MYFNDWVDFLLIFFSCHFVWFTCPFQGNFVVEDQQWSMEYADCHGLQCWRGFREVFSASISIWSSLQLSISNLKKPKHQTVAFALLVIIFTWYPTASVVEGCMPLHVFVAGKMFASKVERKKSFFGMMLLGCQGKLGFTKSICSAWMS